METANLVGNDTNGANNETENADKVPISADKIPIQVDLGVLERQGSYRSTVYVLKEGRKK